MANLQELSSAKYFSPAADEESLAVAPLPARCSAGASWQFASTVVGVAIIAAVVGTFALGSIPSGKSPRQRAKATNNGDWLMRWVGSDLSWEEYNEQQREAFQEQWEESQQRWEDEMPEDSILSQWQRDRDDPPAWSE